MNTVAEVVIYFPGLLLVILFSEHPAGILIFANGLIAVFILNKKRTINNCSMK